MRMAERRVVICPSGLLHPAKISHSGYIPSKWLDILLRTANISPGEIVRTESASNDQIVDVPRSYPRQWFTIMSANQAQVVIGWTCILPVFRRPYWEGQSILRVSHTDLHQSYRIS